MGVRDRNQRDKARERNKILKRITFVSCSGEEEEEEEAYGSLLFLE